MADHRGKCRAHHHATPTLRDLLLAGLVRMMAGSREMKSSTTTSSWDDSQREFGPEVSQRRMSLSTAAGRGSGYGGGLNDDEC